MDRSGEVTSEIDKPVALIRQEDGRVYVKADETCNPYVSALIENSSPFIVTGTPTLTYGFGNVDDTFTMYGNIPDSDGRFALKYKIVDKTEGTETTPPLYTCRLIVDDLKDNIPEQQQFVIAGGIGLVDRGNLFGSSMTYYGPNETFYAPFGFPTAAFKKYLAPVLRYVTDGDDNTVIYEAEGGFKLWEEILSVESVQSDGDVNEADVRYYNLQGQPVAAPVPGTVTIRRTPGSVTKIFTPAE